MPRVAVPVQRNFRSGTARIDSGGTSEVTGDASNGHYVVNDGSTVLWVRNAGGTPRLVTLHFAAKVDGQTIAPRTVTVGANETYLIGPFPTRLYSQRGTAVADRRTLHVDVAHSDLKLQAFSLGK
jgi:hypothetical protein